ncbi:MAG: Spi family protease inhibitor, partial [Candidatus Paceibacterales bacterium]
MQHKFTVKAGLIHFCLSAALVIPFLASAREVPFNTAQKVAENFYKQQSGMTTVLSSLKYTSYDASGNPLFYAFEFNNKKGFVIISAEDAGKPIIGYSTNEVFDIPDPKSNIGLWLADRAKEISYLKTKNIQANDLIKTTWTNYTEFKQASKNSAVNSVAPLLSTTWNQSPQYNALCPGNSVTGCVATAMAQIMKYWNHPAQGTGSSSYCDCVSNGYPNDYGTLSANYAATT